MQETDKFQAKRSKDGNSRRTPYFKHYRAERHALSTLENSSLKFDNRKTYRACRYLYYFVLPHLEKYLWYWPDRVRLLEVEELLHIELQSYFFRRGRVGKLYRVPVRLDRS